MNTLKIYLVLAICIVLSGCSLGYRVQGEKVVWKYWSTNRGSDQFIVENADPASFKVLDISNYAKDKNQVYYKGKVIPKADPASFVPLSDYFAKDNRRGYDGVEEIDSSDGSTFRLLYDSYTVDKKDIYYNTSALNVCNIEKFQLIDSRDINSWATDSCNYFFNGFKIPIKDYQSFRILHYSGFSKDKYQAYWGFKVLEGVDSQTFIVLNQYIGQDKFGCHDWSRRVDCK